MLPKLINKNNSKNMKKSLVVLAAGMGSRYGGLKQMDAFGPKGESILDYSIYDAIEAGFEKVIFVIRESFMDEFKAFFSDKFDDKVEVVYVTQELDKLPEGYTCPEARVKPWGTGHAVMMAKDDIEGDFAVINADDFYGREAYQELIKFFKGNTNNDFASVAYKIKNTLSDHGTVNRGVCIVDKNGNLEKVIETLKIQRKPEGHIAYPIDEDTDGSLMDDALVSMNIWGFNKIYMDEAVKSFSAFLDKNIDIPKSEFYLSLVTDDLVAQNKLNVKVLQSNAKWFGVTYQEDKPIVMEKLNKLIAAKVYPEDLWG